MKPFFRLCQPPEHWTPKARLGFWSWQFLWVALSAVGIGLTSLFLSIGSYPVRYVQGFFATPVLLALNIAPCVCLALLLYGLTRRVLVSYTLTAAVVLGFSTANYFKLLFRDDPLMFADLTIVREAANMLGRYRLFLSRRLAVALAAVILGFFLLVVFAKGRPPKGGRFRHVLALAAAAGCVLSYLFCTDPVLYNGKAADYRYIDHFWSATEQYIAHGFVYPFLNSTAATAQFPPDGYREAEAAALLDACEDADIPTDRQVNVVGIMLEAFQDFSRFDVLDLPEGIYADYHSLEAESVHGDLITNIFAAGTVDTERCFLTGYSSLPDFRGKTNSYPWYFRSQGYQVTGMHPCFQWFYNRVNINENLGFEDYQFIENHFNIYSETTPTADALFFPDLIEDLKARQTGAPLFSFSVTYQGHGPYPTDSCIWGNADDILTPELKAAYSPEAYNIMANYFGSVKDTSRCLLELRDFLAAQEEPYVLVLFGDHNPWMGDGNSVYTAMGLDLDQGTQEGFRNYYATRYLIWANDAAKAATGNAFVGDGPDLGPYFLMNHLFELCGWDGPAYLQATNDVAQRVSVQHQTGMYLENGAFTRELTGEGAILSRDYQWLQYYDKHHFRYRDVD